MVPYVQTDIQGVPKKSPLQECSRILAQRCLICQNMGILGGLSTSMPYSGVLHMSPMCLHLCEPPFLPFTPLTGYLIKGFAIFLKRTFLGHPVLFNCWITFQFKCVQLPMKLFICSELELQFQCKLSFIHCKCFQ